MTVSTIDLATGEITVRDYTPQELADIANAPQPNPADVIRAQINAIEFAKLTSRNTREALIYLAAFPAAATFEHVMTAGTTSSTTFRVRAGTNSGTITVNGVSGGRR